MKFYVEMNEQEFEAFQNFKNSGVTRSFIDRTGIIEFLRLKGYKQTNQDSFYEPVIDKKVTDHTFEKNNFRITVRHIEL